MSLQYVIEHLVNYKVFNTRVCIRLVIYIEYTHSSRVDRTPCSLLIYIYIYTCPLRTSVTGTRAARGRARGGAAGVAPRAAVTRPCVVGRAGRGAGAAPRTPRQTPRSRTGGLTSRCPSRRPRRPAASGAPLAS